MPLKLNPTTCQLDMVMGPGSGTSVVSVGVDDFTAPGTDPVLPTGAGLLTIAGAAVAAHSIPIETHSRAANTFNIEVQVASAITGAPGNTNDAGIASFDDTQFTVDADGFVQLIGGGMAIDTNTGDDSIAVGPSGTGNFNWIGLTVANATHAKPVFFKDSATPNAIDLDVQVAAAVTGAPGDTNDAGLASFNDTQFTVDADGYVALVGGSDLPSIQTLTSDNPTAVGPDGSGDIALTGEAVANALNAKPLFIDAAANALNWEIQVGAAVTGAPGDKLDAGIVSFDDTAFAVDADGYVTMDGSIATSYTTDSGSASPALGVLSILGLSGCKTSGATSVVTIKSPPYADASASATSVLNTGEFVTGAYTRTLPASAGLADGDLIEFVCTSASALVIQAVGTQQIRLGSAISSAAGTCTSTAIGDSISLRFRATDGFWYATSAVGIWNLA